MSILNGSKCVVCGCDTKVINIFDKVPVSSAQLYSDITKPVKYVKQDVSVCDSCNHITNFNYATDIYEDSDYITKKAVGGNMSKNLQNIINDIGTRTNIKVLEIASGSGEIATWFDQNGADVTTVDPCIESYGGNIKHHQKFFDDSFDQGPYDLIIGRHILEHTDDPTNFIRMCKSRLTENGIVYIEVPNMMSSVLNYRLTDFFNDHVQHFSIDSLRICGLNAGLSIISVKTLLENDAHLAVKFIKSQSLKLFEKIDLAKSKHDKIVAQLNEPFTIYGAGAHAVTFSGSLPEEIKANIVAVLDKDTNKTGKYLPGIPVPISFPSEITTNVVVNTSVLYSLEVNNYLRNELNFIGKIVYL